MFNQIFAQYNVNAFNDYVASIKKKQGLKSSTEDLAELIIEALKEEASKMKKGNCAALGLDDKTLEKALIKADGLVPKWKESKNKKTEKKEAPKNTTIGNNYFNKNGQKHVKKEKKETKKDFEKFDLTQLELFDFD